MNLTSYFQIQWSADAMIASLVMVKQVEGNVHEKDVRTFLQMNSVTEGFDEENIRKLAVAPLNTTFPLVVARGQKPTRGRDAYLETTRKTNALQNADQSLESPVDLRQITMIPMASQNEIVARKVEATTGAPGFDVSGNTLPGLKGKDFPLRPGKNTVMTEDGKRLQAVINGQLSVVDRTVHVYPVYEVPGDLSMKTGNITFNGNVVIQGSIPSGFKVAADGDIHVKGSVEASFLKAGGSVFVSEGISGQGKGEIRASYDVHSGYINQGLVFAGHNIYVMNNILHSECEAGNGLVCTNGKGNVIGGKLTAGRWMEIKEVGNSLNTRTALYIGVQEKLLIARRKAESTLLNGKEEKEKLLKLQAKLRAKETASSNLSVQERVMKLRIRQSLSELLDKMTQAADTLQSINDMMDENAGDAIMITRRVFMNTTIHIGKYRRTITKNRDAVNIFLVEGEIHIQQNHERM